MYRTEAPPGSALVIQRQSGTPAPGAPAGTMKRRSYGAIEGSNAARLAVYQKNFGQTAINLVVADAAHAHAADNLTLTQAHTLAIAEAVHAHAADNVVLSVAGTLAIAEALHAHTADNLTLAIGGTTLAIAEALHAHAADNLALTQLHILVISDTLHAHLADTLTLALPGATILHDRVLFIRGETRTLALVAQTRNLTVH
jgi:hypothetical protein